MLIVQVAKNFRSKEVVHEKALVCFTEGNDGTLEEIYQKICKLKLFENDAKVKWRSTCVNKNINVVIVGDYNTCQTKEYVVVNNKDYMEYTNYGPQTFLVEGSS